MNDKELMDLGRKINELVLRIEAKYPLKPNREMSNLGLSKSKSNLLQYLDILGEGTITKLSKISNTSYSFVDRNIKELEQQRLVKKYINPTNKREKYVKFTLKGDKVVQRINDYYISLRFGLIAKIVNSIDEEKSKSLREIVDFSLDKLRAY